MTRKADLLERVEENRAAGLPIARYTLVVEITANSHEELAQRVHGLDINWCHHYTQFEGRDEIDSTDGTTSVLLVQTNPGQTPESYHDELMSWSEQRREARRARAAEPDGFGSTPEGDT